MGCFNLYCLLCSMPSWHNDNFDENWLEEINEIRRKNKQKELDTKKLHTLSKNCNHFNYCTLLTLDDRIIHNAKSDGCTESFQDKNGKSYNAVSDFSQDNFIQYNEDKLTFWIHTDCWNYIKRNYNIKLKASDLPLIKPKDLPKKSKKYANLYIHPFLQHINYGEVIKYCWQDLNYEEIIDDNNEWMCDSLKNETNKKNITRIKKVISQFNFKLEKRKGPQISATFYKDGTVKMGNNGKCWEVKNGKWNELKDEIDEKIFYVPVANKAISNKNKTIKIVNSIPQVSLYNNKALFMTDLTIMILKNERLFCFTLIGSKELIDAIDLESVNIKSYVKNYMG